MSAELAGEVVLERAGAALVVRFNRPATRNALTFAMYDALVRTCQGLENQPEVRVLVITGGPDCFAAGTDLHEFEHLKSGQDYLAYEERADEIAEAIESVPIPTIAAIGGACTGGGAVIATACDLRLVANNVRFGFPIARTLGNCVSVANYTRVALHLGPSLAARLFLSAELIGAPELLSAGFVSGSCDPSELERRAAALADELSLLAPRTVSASKTVLKAVRDQQRPAIDASALILSCYLSEDFKEGRSAFLEKRSPRFSGR